MILPLNLKAAMERFRILRVKLEERYPLFGWLVKQWGQSTTTPKMVQICK